MGLVSATCSRTSSLVCGMESNYLGKLHPVGSLSRRVTHVWLQRMLGRPLLFSQRNIHFPEFLKLLRKTKRLTQQSLKLCENFFLVIERFSIDSHE